MKKIIGICLILIVMSIGIFLNYPKVTVVDLPKDVPIVKGEIVSAKSVRSDDFTRGIVVVVKKQTKS